MGCPPYPSSGVTSGTIDCTFDAQRKYEVEYDADITGAGVVASFVATSLITYIALCVGYLWDSLPNRLANRFDYHLIERVRRVVGWPGIPDEEDAVGRIRREGRAESFQAFLLALSDQVLATGLAMLIAGYWRQCTVSVYSFNIVGSLAWLAATTHLTSVVILRDYHRKYHRVRDLRVLGMVCSVGMLLLSLILQISGNWWEKDDRLFHCALEHFSLSDQSAFAIVSGVLVIVFMISSYINAIVSLYSGNDNCVSAYTWSEDKFAKKCEVSEKDIKGLEGRLLKHVDKILSSHQSPRLKKIRLYCSALWYLYFEYQDSVISILVSLLFSNIYGIASLFLYRSYGWIWSIEGEANQMGFGQIVPLFLLALPLFAAMESYFETSEKNRKATTAAQAVHQTPESTPSNTFTIHHSTSDADLASESTGTDGNVESSAEHEEQNPGAGETTQDSDVSDSMTNQHELKHPSCTDNQDEAQPDAYGRYSKSSRNAYDDAPRKPQRQDTEAGRQNPNSKNVVWPFKIAIGDIYEHTPFRWYMFWLLLLVLAYTIAFALWNASIGSGRFLTLGLYFFLPIFAVFQLWVYRDRAAVLWWIWSHRQKPAQT